MPTYAVLLRGVNLAGQRRVAMADLRALLDGLAYADVQTHLQSGNAVVTTQERAAAVVAAVEAQIKTELGLDVDVMVRSHAQLRSIVQRNPYPDGVADPAKLLVVFLATTPSARQVKELDPERHAPDRFWVRKSEIYAWCPEGVGKSRLPKDFFAKKLSISATARNWNTVTRLLELTA